MLELVCGLLAFFIGFWVSGLIAEWKSSQDGRKAV